MPTDSSGFIGGVKLEASLVNPAAFEEVTLQRYSTSFVSPVTTIEELLLVAWRLDTPIMPSALPSRASFNARAVGSISTLTLIEA